MTYPVDYDKYGHCIQCHTNLRTQQVVGGKVIDRLLPDYDETDFLLDDGSRMRVCMCKKCKPSYDEKDNKKVMDKVFRGWEYEVKEINKWSDEKKKDYLDRYKQRKIVCRSEGLPPDILENKYRKYLKGIE